MKCQLNLIIFLTLFIYLTPITAFSIKRSQSETEGDRQSTTDCSQYEDDNQIIHSFPFFVPLNPSTPNPATTFALMNNNYRVNYTKIVNQKSIPRSIYCLKYLVKLEIVNTSFLHSEQEFPFKFEYFPPSLTYLHIQNTNITHLLNEISKLNGLQILKLSNTSITSLPNSIGALSSLTMLYLPNNGLTSLPETMRKLRKLKEITLFNNPYLHSIEPLNGLSSLQKLDTRNCPIAVLPRNLPQLSTLYMTNNKLTHLNGIDTLGYETNDTKSFYFDMNQIRSVSPKIECVRNLHRLNLNNNELDNLPTNMLSMNKLSYLIIEYNRFHRQHLPGMVSKLLKAIPNLNITYEKQKSYQLTV